MVPSEICCLTTLRVLNCSFQPIEMIPVEIGRLKELQHLVFLNCPIKWVPQSLRQLVNANMLSLRNRCSLMYDATQDFICTVANLCIMDEVRRTCRAFLWMRKRAEELCYRLPRDIARMICDVLLKEAQQIAEGKLVAFLRVC